jgi:hypothetical protein
MPHASEQRCRGFTGESEDGRGNLPHTIPILVIIEEVLRTFWTLHQWLSIRKFLNGKRLTRTSHGSAGALFGLSFLQSCSGPEGVGRKELLWRCRCSQPSKAAANAASTRQSRARLRRIGGADEESVCKWWCLMRKGDVWLLQRSVRQNQLEELERISAGLNRDSAAGLDG